MKRKDLKKIQRQRLLNHKILKKNKAAKAKAQAND